MNSPPILPPESLIPIERPDFWDCAQGICLHPYVTIRRIVNYDPLYGQVILMGALILSSAAGDLKSGLFGFLISIVVYACWYAFGLYATAALFWISGKPLQGKATFAEVCAAVVWPMSPAIIGNILTFAIAPILGTTFSILIAMLAFLYSFKLMIATLAEVQGFGLWKSLQNQLLAMLIGMVLLAIPMVLFWGALFALMVTFMAGMGIQLPTP